MIDSHVFLSFIFFTKIDEDVVPFFFPMTRRIEGVDIKLRIYYYIEKGNNILGLINDSPATHSQMRDRYFV